MNAQTLHCQSCGAAVSSDSPLCHYCGAKLATIACPSCFGMMFLGTEFCPHCGTAASPWQGGEAGMLCPACESPMLEGTVGQSRLHQCGKCFGLWLDVTTFERICRDSEQQAAVLGGANLAQSSAVNLDPVRYRRCPACHELMNRVNFARCSGVVVDICRAHGTWFDRNELQQIVLFVRAGGLDRARGRQKEELAAEARRLEAARSASSGSGTFEARGSVHGGLLDLSVSAAGDLIEHFLH